MVIYKIKSSAHRPRFCWPWRRALRRVQHKWHREQRPFPRWVPCGATVWLAATNRRESQRHGRENSGSLPHRQNSTWCDGALATTCRHDAMFDDQVCDDCSCLQVDVGVVGCCCGYMLRDVTPRMIGFV
jgi:hypothetical protein